jgi:hypothetical protein
VHQPHPPVLYAHYLHRAVGQQCIWHAQLLLCLGGGSAGADGGTLSTPRAGYHGRREQLQVPGGTEMKRGELNGENSVQKNYW